MYTCLKKALPRPVIYGTEVVKKKWKLRVRFRLENKTNLHYAAVVLKKLDIWFKN